jgi:hypothetical protein
MDYETVPCFELAGGGVILWMCLGGNGCTESKGGEKGTLQ